MNIKTGFLIFIFLIINFFSCSNPKTQKHIGLWEAQNSAEEKIVLEFTKDNFNFNDGINIVEGKYFIDYSRDPIWLDIIMTDGKHKKLSKTIINFFNNNQMKIYASFEEKRPQQFDNDDRIIIFSRKK